MKPLFAVVEKNYPRKLQVTREALFNEIGWGDLINNGNYENTCAIRVSLALVKSNLHLPGRMQIKAGQFKGRMIEPGQAKLSHLLTSKVLLGRPEKFMAGQAEDAIGTRRGIVSFWVVHPNIGDTMGHIDIVSQATGGIKMCGSSCYWGSKEVWFWPLE